MKTDKVINGVLIKATQPRAGRRYIWPDGVTKIGKHAFSNWKSFNHPFSIPEGVTEIGEWAFSRWESFNRPFSIPEGVHTIGEYAFYYWRSFNQPFNIPESVTKIGKCAFYSWVSFNQPFSIPEGVTEIGEYAFYYWKSFNRSNLSNKSRLPMTESIHMGDFTAALREWRYSSRFTDAGIHALYRYFDQYSDDTTTLQGIMSDIASYDITEYPSIYSAAADLAVNAEGNEKEVIDNIEAAGFTVLIAFNGGVMIASM